ncbi:hypothetical protein OSI38_25195, partial [Mycobacterium ulcerans]
PPAPRATNTSEATRPAGADQPTTEPAGTTVAGTAALTSRLTNTACQIDSTVATRAAVTTQPPQPDSRATGAPVTAATGDRAGSAGPASATATEQPSAIAATATGPTIARVRIDSADTASPAPT